MMNKKFTNKHLPFSSKNQEERLFGENLTILHLLQQFFPACYLLCENSGLLINKLSFEKQSLQSTEYLHGM